MQRTWNGDNIDILAFLTRSVLFMFHFLPFQCGQGSNVESIGRLKVH